MKFRHLLPLLLCVALSPARASEEGSKEKRPGWVSRTLQSLNPFRRSEGDASERGDARAVRWKKLSLTMQVEPSPVRLSETRQIKVTLRLENRGRRLIQLEFPTTQRIEVLLRRKDGRLVEQWSEDQAFANEATVVAINPGERLEYAVSVATRDLAAGQPYTIEAFFPNYEQLRTSLSIVPEK